MSDHEQQGIDQQIKKLAMAGLGAVSSAVEKSKEAISEFASKENLEHLAHKGEEALEQVKSFGAETAQKIKKAWDDSAQAAQQQDNQYSLQRLAHIVNDLQKEDRAAFDALLRQMDEGDLPEDGSLQSEQPFHFGKTQPSAPVQEMAEGASPTAVVDPDNESNINILRTNDMNEHIPQGVPRDF